MPRFYGSQTMNVGAPYTNLVSPSSATGQCRSTMNRVTRMRSVATLHFTAKAVEHFSCFTLHTRFSPHRLDLVGSEALSTLGVLQFGCDTIL